MSKKTITLRSIKIGDPPDEGKDDRPFASIAVSTSKEELVLLLSEALKSYRYAELRYQHWKASLGKSFLDQEPRLPRWKMDAITKASKEYVERKSDQLNAEHDVEIIRVLLGIKQKEVER